MPFSLSFSPDFFHGTAELTEMEPSDQPMSILQAILSLTFAQRREIARDVFGCDSANLTDDMILRQVVETDTCTDLMPPVEAWVDGEGFHTIEVFD